MPNKRRILAATTSALACIAFGSVAMAAHAPVTGALSSSGRTVMAKASRANITEIEEGRLALTHSRNTEVQALGNRLVQDHSKAEDALEALAASMHVKLPTKPSAKQQLAIARLGALKGPAFDRLFATTEVAAHRKTIMALGRAKSEVRSPALEAWVKQSIPVLEEHLQLARNLPSQVAMTGKAQGAVARRR